MINKKMLRKGLKTLLVCFSCLILLLCIGQYRIVKQTLIIGTYNRFEGARSDNHGHLDNDKHLVLAVRKNWVSESTDESANGNSNGQLDENKYLLLTTGKSFHRNLIAEDKDNDEEEHVISVEQRIWTEAQPEVMAMKKKKKKKIFISLGLYNDRKEILRSIPYDYDFTDTDGTACPVNHCETTYDRTKVNSSDAVYFDARVIHELDIAILEQLRSRSTSQIWMWLMHENPNFTYYNVSKYDRFFNWSATYRPSSDIYIPVSYTHLTLPTICSV